MNESWACDGLIQHLVLFNGALEVCLEASCALGHLRPRPEKAREGCPAEGVQGNIRNRDSAKTALLSVS